MNLDLKGPEIHQMLNLLKQGNVQPEIIYLSILIKTGSEITPFLAVNCKIFLGKGACKSQNHTYKFRLERGLNKLSILMITQCKSGKGATRKIIYI